MTPDQLLALLGARRGHFSFESGRHGGLWLDLDRLLLRRQPLGELLRPLIDHLLSYRPEVVCGPLVGGAFVAHLLAEQLDVDFVYADRLVQPIRYCIPKQLRSTLKGRRVAVVDDAIQAGSALTATLADLEMCEADPVALAAPIVLGNGADGLATARGLPLICGVRIADETWAPERCPLCAAKVPHDGPVVRRDPSMLSGSEEERRVSADLAGYKMIDGQKTPPAKCRDGTPVTVRGTLGATAMMGPWSP